MFNVACYDTCLTQVMFLVHKVHYVDRDIHSVGHKTGIACSDVKPQG